MLKTISCKKLSIDDLSTIMAIGRQAMEIAWSASMMKDSLRAAHCQAWGIFEEDRLVGYGVLSVVFDEAELLSMAIDPIYQRRGYGKKLLEHLMFQALRSGAESLYLELRVTNLPAISLYDKMGFERIGIRKNYYPTTDITVREDAILMKRLLAAK